MAKCYDIVERLKAKNAKPSIKLDEDHIFTVNNSKNIMLEIMALANDAKDSDGTASQIKLVDKVIRLTLGDKAFDYIQSLDMSADAYMYLMEAIVAAMNGTEIEEDNAKN